MLVDLEGWTRLFVPDGVLLIHPDPSVGRIRIAERQPIRTLRSLVERLRHELPPGSRFELLDGPRPIETAEGEYAALVVGQIRSGDLVLERDLGVAIGDEHCTIVDGRVERAASFASFRGMVEQLTVNTCLGLGALRWRRYYYDPPAGWQGLARPRSDVWLAPGHPRNPGMIHVFHARPSSTNDATVAHHLLYEMAPRGFVREAQPEEATARSGLRGQSATFHADAIRMINVAFEDDRFLYPLRLETDHANEVENQKAFQAVADSVRPLPRPRAAAQTPSPFLD